MVVVWTVLGVALIAVAVRDAFATLFQPTEKGGLNQAVGRAVFGVLRAIAKPLQRRRPEERRLMVLAGPLALFLVIFSWAALVAAGAAFIFWPHLPEDFTFASGLRADAQDTYFDALYFSLSNLTTLGIGDITPKDDWLRVVAVGQALAGMGLITAAVSWLIVIYPAIGRKRGLAQTVSVYLRSAGGSWEAMLDRSAERSTAFMAEVTSRLAAMRADLAQFPVVYGFEVLDQSVILPSILLDLCDLAEVAGREHHPPGVRVEAQALGEALATYATTLRDVVLGGDWDTRETFERYADEHLVEPEARHGQQNPGGEGT